MLASTQSGGPYSLVATPGPKVDASLAVAGLTPGTTYSVVVGTFASPHAGNDNTVVSEPTAEVYVNQGYGSAHVVVDVSGYFQ